MLNQAWICANLSFVISLKAPKKGKYYKQKTQSTPKTSGHKDDNVKRWKPGNAVYSGNWPIL